MRTIPFADLSAQYAAIRDEINRAIAAVIAENAFAGGRSNPFVRGFEERFAAFLGTRNCISCANGTDSLEMLLKAYGIGPGDEVIVPALSWISTSGCVLNVGAVPVFTDIHPKYYTMDPAQIEEKITGRTRAILPVHLYGLPADMVAVMAVAGKYGLKVIEDAAQAHGAEFRGRMAGTIGDAGSFSFYPGKNLGAFGDAGCMVTNDENLAEKVRLMANHGQPEKHTHLIAGRNSRMDGIQAAVLQVKLEYLEAWNAARREKAEIYRRNLESLPVVLPEEPAGTKHVYHVFAVRVPQRDRIRTFLRDHGIMTSVHYPEALPFLPPYLYLGYSREAFPVAGSVTGSLLSLPMFPELGEEEIVYICEKMKEALTE